MSAILLLIDFEKAFDSLEWTFVDRTLSYFNFTPNLMKWVKMFYNKIESCLINNGYCSERFELGEEFGKAATYLHTSLF
jgi:hypothetical protein